MIEDVDWSPDGTSIVFSHANGPDQSELIVINANGSSPRLLAVGGGDVLWSPDSRRIAFLNGAKGTRLNMVNADGHALTILTDLAGWPFVWLPDSSGFIAYNRDGSILHIDLNGQTTVLANIAKYTPHWTPALSPDGTKIAFIRMDAPYPDLYVMNVDGTHLVRLTHNPGYNTCFDWPF
jgi:Tol biopolymer transport system component